MTGSPAPAAVIIGPLLPGCTAVRTGSGGDGPRTD